MEIGSLKIDNNLVLAPIAGYTDSPFRRIARKHGSGLVVTELISTEGIIRKNKKTMDMVRFHEDERPVGIQIFGSKIDVMAEAAKIVETYGPDFIDINMGCPARKVYGSGSGSAILSDPKKVEEIARAVVDSVKLPVTAKIRTGLNENNLTYAENVKALENAGVKAIFVHGRTRDQMYTGLADWNIINEIATLTNVPVFGNGDVVSHGQALDLLKNTACAGIMIGRGAFGNPWIFSGKGPSIEELIQQILEHLDMMLEFHGDIGLYRMRKHIAKYINGFRNASKIRSDLLNAHTPDEIHEILNSIAPI